MLVGMDWIQVTDVTMIKKKIEFNVLKEEIPE